MATDAAPERHPPLPRRLSEELADVRNRFAERPVTLREVIYTLRGRAYTLLLILLSLGIAAGVASVPPPTFVMASDCPAGFAPSSAAEKITALGVTASAGGGPTFTVFDV